MILGVRDVQHVVAAVRETFRAAQRGGKRGSAIARIPLCPGARDAVVELLLGATRVLHSRARAKQAATQRNDGSRRGSWTVSSQPAWLAAALYSRRFNRIMGKPMPYGELQRSFL